MQRKYKYVTICMLSAITLLCVISGVKILQMPDAIIEEENLDVDVPALSTDEPVAGTTMTIVKPYNNKNVSIAVDYYDINGENQENSIIVTDKTYMPNVGVLYSSKESFDVLCVLDGKVSEVGKNDLIGNYVKITHSDNLVSLYQIIDDITVEKGDYIKQGDKIGSSSTSSLAQDNLLLFELLINNENVNPEKYYNKSTKEI